MAKTAKLARLELSEQEKKDFSGELSLVFSYFKCISSVDTKGISPLVYPLEGLVPPPALRPDEGEPSLNREALLNLAPQKLGSEYKVPPVVE